MVGRSVMAKKLQDAKSKQEKLERQQRSKKSSVGDPLEARQMTDPNASSRTKFHQNPMGSITAIGS
jgi:hypothetical protein